MASDPAPEVAKGVGIVKGHPVYYYLQHIHSFPSLLSHQSRAFKLSYILHMMHIRRDTHAGAIQIYIDKQMSMQM